MQADIVVDDVRQQIEAGVLRSQADAARRLGITEGRIKQIQNLALLSPSVQEAILVGEIRESERRLRRVVNQPDWSRQRRT